MFFRREETAPPQVLKRVPPGAFSVRWEAVSLSGRTGWLHLWVKPKGRSDIRGTGLSPAEQARPLTREEIASGALLAYSPFTVELYASPDAPEPLHTATFDDECTISEVAVKYLKPAAKQGPIVLMNGGVTHWRSWTLLILPDGFGGKRTVLQRFMWGGEGGTGVEQKFDGTDARGNLQIRENAYDEGKPETTTFYRWDAYRFVDPDARWFVLGAVSKDRADADNFIRKYQVTDYAEVVSTSRFPRLASNLYAVVLARRRTEKEAADEAKRFKAIGVACYVKRAF